MLKVVLVFNRESLFVRDSWGGLEVGCETDHPDAQIGICGHLATRPPTDVERELAQFGSWVQLHPNRDFGRPVTARRDPELYPFLMERMERRDEFLVFEGRDAKFVAEALGLEIPPCASTPCFDPSLAALKGAVPLRGLGVMAWIT